MRTRPVALVTGAARGIGAATAELLAARGVDVMLADVDADALSTTAARLGADHVVLDVAKEDDWARAMATVAERQDRLDVLVNSAGLFEIAAIADTSVAMYARIVAVNQTGSFLGIRAAAPLMARSGGGSVVNLSSVAGLRGRAGTIAYSSSKWAVRGITKAAAAELAPLGIRVNSVHPGAVDTEMLSSLGGDRSIMGPPTPVPLKRMAHAVEVTRMIAFLALDESSYGTGAEFVCDGGMTAV